MTPSLLEAARAVHALGPRSHAAFGEVDADGYCTSCDRTRPYGGWHEEHALWVALGEAIKATDPRVAAATAIYVTGARPDLPAISVVEGVRDGRCVIPTGDPRYCWNPFIHDPHDFHYTLDNGTTGAYPCDGVTPHLWAQGKP